MSQPVVPYTAILRRYHEVCARDDESRYNLARELNDAPGLLASDFAESVSTLDASYASGAPFRPAPRVPREPRQPGISNGTDLAWYLHRQRILETRNEPTLTAEWVDYELSILSTRGGAVFDKPRYGATERNLKPGSAGGPLKADLMLVNVGDRTPVVGEVKVERDKEPFSALVQLLAYIAHLSTQSQYARLRSQLATADYVETDPPRFDGYLLLYRFGESPNTWLNADPERSLLTESERMSAQLMKRPEITAHIRRLVCVDVALDSLGKLGATARWVHSAEVP